MSVIAKYRKECFPNEWFLTDFTMQQVEGYIDNLEARYSAILTRHNALREAVAWERECEEFEPFDTRVVQAPESWLSRYAESHRIKQAARAEVDRLIANETSADCKEEEEGC